MTDVRVTPEFAQPTEGEALERLKQVVTLSPRESLRTFVRIRRELIISPLPKPWLAAAREMRRQRIIGDDVHAYFAEIFVEGVVARASEQDAELCRITSAMHEIAAKAGVLDDEVWSVDDAPKDWSVLSIEWTARADEIAIAFLHEAGDHLLAEEKRRSPRGVEAAVNRGRRELFGDTVSR